MERENSEKSLNFINNTLDLNPNIDNAKSPGSFERRGYDNYGFKLSESELEPYLKFKEIKEQIVLKQENKWNKVLEKFK